MVRRLLKPCSLQLAALSDSQCEPQRDGGLLLEVCGALTLRRVSTGKGPTCLPPPPAAAEYFPSLFMTRR